MPLPPSQTLAGRVLRLPLQLVPKNAVVTVRRGINRGARWRVGSSVHGCWLGTYEPDKQAVVREFVKPGMNVLDVGANAGFYTLAFSAIAKHVWAAEPFAENVENLLRHVRINGRENVTVVQAAISDCVGMGHFHAAANNSTGKLTRAATSLMVPTTTLDTLIQEGMPAWDVVKVDVEGAELGVLKGAAKLLAMRRTTWLIALDSVEDRDACRSLMQGYGYRLRDIGRPEEIVAYCG